MGKTFVEKIFGADAGEIVFKTPNIVLTHDNTASIIKTFKKMGGQEIFDPSQLLVVLDHNAPPTTAKLSTDYQEIREFAEQQNINNFYDAGKGICHQIMAQHAKPGMIIVGSDSHTCTAGAFNAMAAGIDRTEAAGIWRRGETWFKVPETMKITLNGKLPEGVFAKDISLWIIGLIGAAGANYMSIEYHGQGLKYIGISERMTIANLASEMGAKNAVFPPDEILDKFLKTEQKNKIWADEDAKYAKEITINLNELFPVVAAPHQVDNIKSLAEIRGTKINEAFIGTCTNGRIEDLRAAAKILKNKKIAKNVQLIITPASQKIYLQALKEGIIETFINAGGNVLSASCGPCLGTGQGIPADGFTVISTANRNFLGRMGNKNAQIFLASPAVVAYSAIKGKIEDPRKITEINTKKEKFNIKIQENKKNIIINDNENRKNNKIWNYADIDDLNTDLMFAGKHTYKVLSSDPQTIIPFLFEDFDPNFVKNAEKNDIIIAGENFGCGSSREHPAVGLAHIGIKAVIVKSVNRIFFRSSINQGLVVIVHKNAVNAYKKGQNIKIDIEKGKIIIQDKTFNFSPLPEKLMEIINKKGLINWINHEKNN